MEKILAITGNGPPVGFVTPEFLGQEYIDLDSGNHWKSNELSNTSWFRVNINSLPVSGGTLTGNLNFSNMSLGLTYGGDLNTGIFSNFWGFTGGTGGEILIRTRNTPTGQSAIVRNFRFHTGGISLPVNNIMNLGDISNRWATLFAQNLNNGANISIPSQGGTLALLSDLEKITLDSPTTYTVSNIPEFNNWINNIPGNDYRVVELLINPVISEAIIIPSETLLIKGNFRTSITFMGNTTHTFHNSALITIQNNSNDTNSLGEIVSFNNAILSNVNFNISIDRPNSSNTINNIISGKEIYNSNINVLSFNNRTSFGLNKILSFNKIDNCNLFISSTSFNVLFNGFSGSDNNSSIQNSNIIISNLTVSNFFINSTSLTGISLFNNFRTIKNCNVNISSFTISSSQPTNNNATAELRFTRSCLFIESTTFTISGITIIRDGGFFRFFPIHNVVSLKNCTINSFNIPQSVFGMDPGGIVVQGIGTALMGLVQGNNIGNITFAGTIMQKYNNITFFGNTPANTLEGGFNS